MRSFASAMTPSERYMAAKSTPEMSAMQLPITLPGPS